MFNNIKESGLPILVLLLILLGSLTAKELASYFAQLDLSTLFDQLPAVLIGQLTRGGGTQYIVVDKFAMKEV